MPKTAELANCVLDLVADELEVPKDRILSRSRNAETVDARHLTVNLLYCRDIYPSRIARLFGISSRSVRQIISSFDARVQTNRLLRDSFARIRKQLGDI